MIEIFHAHIIPAALSVLPPEMDTIPARAILLAIGLQESRFEHRRQINGPARGMFQFEYGGGLAGVMTHRATRGHLDAALCAQRYEGVIDEPARLFTAIEHNDVLACVCARLLLWTLPGALPDRYQPMTAWDQYLQAWRPGKPHMSTWRGYWADAWELVEP